MQRRSCDEVSVLAARLKGWWARTWRLLRVAIVALVVFAAAAASLTVDLEEIMGWLENESQDGVDESPQARVESRVDAKGDRTQPGPVAQDLGEHTDGVAGSNRSATGDSSECGPQRGEARSSLEAVGTTTPQALGRAAPIPAEQGVTSKPADDAVLVGRSMDSMRARNGVRRMLQPEEQQDLSQLTQVYGFANHRWLK